jgi:hypothetical protein
MTFGSLREIPIFQYREKLESFYRMMAVMYLELWEPQINSWEVWPMPFWIIAQNANNPNLNANLINMVVIPNNVIVNPHCENAVILGYLFPWNATFFLCVPGQTLDCPRAGPVFAGPGPALKG